MFPFTGLPVITTPLKDADVPIGGNVTLMCLATGQGPMMFTWETYSNSSGWYAVVGIRNTTSYMVMARTDGRFMYRCVVSNEAGAVTSDEATINVFGKYVQIVLCKKFN